MQFNILRCLIALVAVAIIGCSSATSKDELYGSGFIVVSEVEWDTDYTNPYPFTVPEGEISCGSHPVFGREVYFEPKGYTDESYIGTPLNRSAANAIKQGDLRANVPYSIKEGADLKEVIQIGLNVCDEQENMLKKR